jgi:hypothetical protein
MSGKSKVVRAMSDCPEMVEFRLPLDEVNALLKEPSFRTHDEGRLASCALRTIQQSRDQQLRPGKEANDED